MKITEDFLIEQGFVDTGKTHAFSKIWRKPYKDTGGFFNFIKGDYHETNSNCGVLGIYYPEEDIHTVPKDLVNKKVWTEEDDERARNYTIRIDSCLVNIAFYLDDTERFLRIISDLSYTRKIL
jgi:hypothetical protein